MESERDKQTKWQSVRYKMKKSEAKRGGKREREREKEGSKGEKGRKDRQRQIDGQIVIQIGRWRDRQDELEIKGQRKMWNERLNKKKKVLSIFLNLFFFSFQLIKSYKAIRANKILPSN